MAADLVAGGGHRPDYLGMTLGGHGHGEYGQRDRVLVEQLEQAPNAGAAAVFVERFHTQVALALQRLRGDHLGEEGLGFRVAMQNVALAAFLVIEHERQGNTGVARPVWVWRVVGVTDQVAWVVSAHCSLPS
ncbi:hypothetical protein D9M68_639910 [compost metagenome]